jgi:hypothetical protein
LGGGGFLAKNTAARGLFHRVWAGVKKILLHSVFSLLSYVLHDAALRSFFLKGFSTLSAPFRFMESFIFTYAPLISFTQTKWKHVQIIN